MEERRRRKHPFLLSQDWMDGCCSIRIVNDGEREQGRYIVATLYYALMLDKHNFANETYVLSTRE